jgi:hypothetical protein
MVEIEDGEDDSEEEFDEDGSEFDEYEVERQIRGE